MLFVIECIVACILFTLMIKLATWKKQTAFNNDYPPVVVGKLRTRRLIAQKPPARKKDYIRKAVAMVVFAFLFALLAPFDKFYRLSGVSAFDPSAVRFHFIHSVYGMGLGLPVAVVAGLLVMLM